ncbi:MAG: T9SS type A sorting domain-containing protein [Bacteroidetes bacterium]|nr:MAG: T9SS type A sorting domain-containing protein [Bacteroidota bacterium]
MNLFKINITVFLIIVGFLCLKAETTKDHTVMVAVTTDTIPTPRIKLSFPLDTSALEYTIYRKYILDDSWGETLSLLPGTATEFIDSNIRTGRGFEYKVKKKLKDYDAFFYTYAGINVPQTDYNGIALLLIDSTVSDLLDSELTVYENDLIRDGWLVHKHLVPRAEKFNPSAVHRVKSIILDEYRKYNNEIKSVILFGRVPVPYSGDAAVDDHDPDHRGAWPADLYYGEVDGNWTDNIIDEKRPARDENKNIPGDGKFDQVVIPSNVDIPVGRIDMYELPGMSPSEIELLKRYLDKNHKYRSRQLIVDDKCLIDDKFGMYSSEAFAANAWMNFTALTSIENIDTGSFLHDMDNKSYLWAYGCNSGGYTSVLRVAYVPEFNSLTYNSVFTILFGSYLADWDFPDNIMRAAIASEPSILTCSWSGRPFWQFQHMGLGETIGYSTLLSQNNQYLYETSGLYGYRMIHVSLIGDPTLKMLYVAPPENFNIISSTISPDSAYITMQWQNSTDSDIIGYNIYRTDDLKNKFQKINSAPIIDSVFIDHSPKFGNNIYMVRAIKNQKSASGNYFNLSLGLLAETDFPKINFTDMTASLFNVYPNPASDRVYIAFLQQKITRFTIGIYDLNGKIIRIIGAGRIPPGRYLYSWDLRDINWDKVSAGIYLIKFETTEGTTVSKILVY